MLLTLFDASNLTRLGRNLKLFSFLRSIYLYSLCSANSYTTSLRETNEGLKHLILLRAIVLNCYRCTISNKGLKFLAKGLNH